MILATLTLHITLAKLHLHRNLRYVALSNRHSKNKIVLEALIIGMARCGVAYCLGKILVNQS